MDTHVFQAAGMVDARMSGSQVQNEGNFAVGYDAYNGSAYLPTDSYQVIMEVSEAEQLTPDGIGRLMVRADGTTDAPGALVPLSAIGSVRWVTGPVQTVRYNGYPAMKIGGDAAAGYSTGDAMAEMERLAAQLPQGFGYEWTEIALQEKLVGNTAPIAFGLAVVFVFLVLTSVVSLWRDYDNSQFTLASAWNVTNTFILGAFMVVALKEYASQDRPQEAAPPPAAPPDAGPTAPAGLTCLAELYGGRAEA